MCSQVFSEKMGLEAGWNCHISLLSDSPETKAQGQPTTGFYDAHITLKNRRHSFHTAIKITKHHSHSLALNRNRRKSAPDVLSVEPAQVKYSYLCLKLEYFWKPCNCFLRFESYIYFLYNFILG